MNLWNYIDSKAETAYMEYAHAAGANLTDEYDPEYICNLGDLHQKIYDWFSANRELCQETGTSTKANRHADAVGYDNAEYDWGLIGDSNEQLKELIGGPAAFKKLGLSYDSSQCRLFVQMPGMVVPWHTDEAQGWQDMFVELDPKVKVVKDSEEMTDQEAREQSICNKGVVIRRLMQVSPWHWGHFMEMKNTFITNWKAGDVWNVPAAVGHLTGNAGIKLRVSMTITGVSIDS